MQLRQAVGPQLLLLLLLLPVLLGLPGMPVLRWHRCIRRHHHRPLLLLQPRRCQGGSHRLCSRLCAPARQARHARVPPRQAQ